MATLSSILAWKIPWTEESGGKSIGLQRVGHDWGHMHTYSNSEKTSAWPKAAQQASGSAGPAAQPPRALFFLLSQVILSAFSDISTLRRVLRFQGGSGFLWLLCLVWKVVFQLPCDACESEFSWFTRPCSAFLFFARLEEGRSSPLEGVLPVLLEQLFRVSFLCS